MKCSVSMCLNLLVVSPPSRGAWIEIETVQKPNTMCQVAPLAGGVD